MKYVIVLGDGMADEPIEAAGGKTPLQLADKPVMDGESFRTGNCIHRTIQFTSRK